jgi:CRISPR system Cascade subunit CasC
MKHLELHIIQSVPVACLNRDDLNSPKTAVFGGFQRARVSSQCWKRAIREMAKEFSPERFKGKRTRRFVFSLTQRLQETGMEPPVAMSVAEAVADVVETLDSKKDESGFKKIKTPMFFADEEYAALAKAIAAADKVKNTTGELAKALEEIEAAELEQDKEAKKNAEKKKNKALKAMDKVFEKKEITKIINSACLNDAADISLFGRMVANLPSVTKEAAAMFSHALSTHKANNEIDFFAAVDDLQGKNESGAAITSTLEFNSATYYRFAALNLDMLKDEEHLYDLTPDQRKAVVRTFIEATIKAIPGARKNTMNANTLPVYVLGVVRDKGHPLQLVNAFENPVRPRQGYADQSVKLLKEEYAKLKDTWGVEAVLETAIPDVNLNAFLDEVVKHVD